MVEVSGARARVESAVRQPSGIFPARWVASNEFGASAPPAFDLRDLFPLCVEWRYRSPEIARELVLSAVAVQHPDGSFPRCVDELGHASDMIPAWPLFACAANVAAGDCPPSDFAAVVLPALERHVEWAWKHLGAANGAPKWPSELEAWLPEAWSPDVRSVDAAAMLLAEIESFMAFGERCNAGGAIRLRLGSRAAALSRLLDRVYFDPATGEYRDRSADGQVIARRTLSMFTPLLCSAVRGDRRQQLLNQLSGWWDASTSSFPAWEQWPDDPAPPAVVPRQQALIWAAIAAHGGATRSEWRTRSAAVATAPWAQNGICGALAVLLSVAACGGTSEQRVRIMGPRLGATVAASVAGVGMLLGVGLYMMGRPSLPGATGEALLNLARESYNAGDHEQAISLYREFLARSRSTNGVVCVLLANALYRRGQYREAEEFYRAALQEEGSALHALYNLGLTLHQQGRDGEAIYVLDKFAGTYRDDYPELAQRARTAAAIIRGLPLDAVSLP